MMKELKELENLVQEYGILLHSIKIEKKTEMMFNDYDRLKETHNKYIELKTKIKGLGVDLTNNKSVKKFKTYHDEFAQVQRDMLMSGVDLRNKLVKTNDGYLNAAIDIRKDTTQKLKDGLALIQTTIDVGANVSNQLEENRQQIVVISKDLDKTDSELKMANKSITRIIKRIGTDKIFIVFIFLVIAGAVLAGLIGSGVIKIK